MYGIQSWGETLLLLVELSATAAFALSGLMEAARKQLDAVGVCVVAFLAAFGGGTLRDLLLDQRPFFWVQHVEVLWGVMALCVLAMLFMRQRHFEVTEKAILWPDALGLGLFTATGVHVVYGIVGLKTHCKLALVIRQEGNQLKRYCHIGTGNYNPKTARFYEDYGLLTSRDSVGEDLTKLFNQLSGYAPEAQFKSLLVSPNGVREGLVERIDREIAHKAAGKPARIRVKVNSLVDEQIIDALYKASCAGVEVEILVRGMCALKPGVPGLSENIRVRSVLGRYLEHSRVFGFLGGGDPAIFIGSADMMHRNLDRRVEALVRISQPDHIRELNGMFDLALDESSGSWHLNSDGTWTRHQYDANHNLLVDVQDKIMKDVYAKRGSRNA